MAVIAIDHVQLAMPPGGEDKARAFYAGVLGLDEIPKPEGVLKLGGAWFTNRKVELHVGAEENFRPARKAHPALVVDDLDAVLDAARRFGSEVVDALQLPGRRRGFVHDPFGNRIELIELERR
jgi:catechol 2,3-dioxygenase-like lactoylglutathione lyase family enzyme